MSDAKKTEILEEMVAFVSDYTSDVPYWFNKAFTTEEFGDEMLSPAEWWVKKLEQLENE
jgi:hypothetical protein